MEGFKMHLHGWEDGQKVDQELEVTDRWAIHAADEVQLTVGNDIDIRIKQQPKALNASRMGVGACVWEGEMLLAAYLASLPRHRFQGARCVELGCGPGLAGMVLAKMGADVVLTDKGCVLPLVHDNVQLNGLSREQRRGHPNGWVEVQELEWGTEQCDKQAVVLAQDPIDWVVAADCIYVDNEGQSPSTEHFIKTCHTLCSGARTSTCLISFELRSSHVKEVFLREADKIFAKVTRIPATALPKGCQVEHIELYEMKA